MNNKNDSKLITCLLHDTSTLSIQSISTNCYRFTWRVLCCADRREDEPDAVAADLCVHKWRVPPVPRAGGGGRGRQSARCYRPHLLPLHQRQLHATARVRNQHPRFSLLRTFLWKYFFTIVRYLLVHVKLFILFLCCVHCNTIGILVCADTHLLCRLPPFPCFISFFFRAQVLWTTLTHEFLIFNMYTKWNLFLFLSDHWIFLKHNAIKLNSK